TADDGEDVQLFRRLVGVGLGRDLVVAGAGALDLHELDLPAPELILALEELHVVPDRRLHFGGRVVGSGRLQQPVRHGIRLREVEADSDRVGRDLGWRDRAAVVAVVLGYTGRR